MLLMRSLAFALGMWLALLVVGPLGMLTWPLPFAIRFQVISQWARFNVWWLGVTCNVRYQVIGRENIPAGNGIVLCKHQSTWETLVLQQIFPLQVWLLKRELLWVPIFGWALALLEPIAIDRGAGRRAVQQLVKQGKQKLAQGRWVVIYPEGTRMAPGQRGRYALGGAILAEHSGYPVVPVAHNAGEYWPRRQFIKRPGTIRLVIGPVIETRGRKAQDINAEVEAWIEAQMDAITTQSTPLD
jgi:1-acyl-sn-glycerol-3-phosphate acyltransferase